jgi:spoIIIJ-associated protein
VEWVEVTGKTVDEAKDRALDKLGVDEREAEFEVLEEPKVGFLGRLKGEARVRARVRPTTPRPKSERRDRRRRGEGERGHRGRGSGGGRAGNAPVATADDDAIEVATPAKGGSGSEDSGGGSRRRRRRRSSRPADGGSDAAAADDDDRSSEDAAPQERGREEKVTDMADLPVDEQAQIVARFVEGLIDAFGMTATTNWAVVDDETAEVSVEGQDLGLLVGPKGRTLQALNEVARSVVVRQADGTPNGRVHLDVAGYRQRRREALGRFATQLAEQVKATGVPAALEPMGSADRKIVHDTVNELEGVSSTSEGEEPNRRVVILPGS